MRKNGLRRRKMDVNYKNKKRYNTAKYPIRQPLIIVWHFIIVTALAYIPGLTVYIVPEKQWKRLMWSFYPR